jgi:TolB-like protein/DNA-binding winged helix-turn-helix (wHTH) protein/Tfp pilus assembly protein PilF
MSALRFGAFELDLKTGELRKSGAPINLPPQPARILAVLASRSGQLVTREEIQKQIWGDETYVDFEQGLNFAIKKIRTALSDDAETPRYIETLPRRGYRFIAPVEGLPASTAQVSGDAHGSLEVATRGVMSALAHAVLERGTAGARRRLGAVLALAIIGLVAALVPLGRSVQWSEWLGAKLSPERITSLAVLPLENLSGDQEQDYFADGMTEALITDLGKTENLRVISRTSVIQYKGAKKPLPRIARELGVDAIVEGTVTLSGNRVRITAQLIRARKEAHLWSETYEGELGNILKLQGEVASDITRKIQGRLTAQQSARLGRARPVNPEAYEAYLKGRYFWNKLTRKELFDAVGYFNKAAALDPDYAPVYSGLAECYMGLGLGGGLPPGQAFPRAKEAAAKAVALDETLSDAHTSLATAYLYADWNWVMTEKEFKRAIQLNPSDELARAGYADYLFAMNRQEESLEEVRKAVLISPLSNVTNQTLAWLLYLARQYDPATDQLRKMLELYPDAAYAHALLAGCYGRKGMEKESVEEDLKAFSLSGDNPDLVASLRQAYRRSGIRGYWQAQARLRLEQSKREYVKPYEIAQLYALEGEKEQAFAWLEKAYREHSGDLVLLLREPSFDELRSDQRFQELMRRVGLPP